MCKTEKSFAAIARLLNEERLFIDRKLDFISLCGMVGAEASDVDGLVFEELGLTGEQWLSELRREFSLHLRESFALTWDY